MTTTKPQPSAFEIGAKEIKRQIDSGEITNEDQLNSAFEMLDHKVQAELNAMTVETQQLRERATSIVKRIALRDALLDRGVAPRMIKGASAVINEYVHVHLSDICDEQTVVTGPDHMPLADFIDAWCEAEGQAFLNGNSTHRHEPGLMSQVAKNLS